MMNVGEELMLYAVAPRSPDVDVPEPDHDWHEVDGLFVPRRCDDGALPTEWLAYLEPWAHLTVIGAQRHLMQACAVADELGSTLLITLGGSSGRWSRLGLSAIGTVTALADQVQMVAETAHADMWPVNDVFDNLSVALVRGVKGRSLWVGGLSL